MGSLFLVSLWKTPGAEVTSDTTDDIISTSYSGIESACSPTGERCGEYTFVSQSVWSDY